MKLNEFNIENVMVDYKLRQFEEMHEIVKETIKENKTLKNTIDIQKLKIDILEKEKQQFINFIIDKLKRCEEINEWVEKHTGNTSTDTNSKIELYQEILDFVGGGKDE